MRRAITWQLVLGLLIVGGWLVLGVAAPLLTRTDPLKTTTLLMDGTRAVIAPYDPGTYGFPLGSDRSGRDLWTGVMYGARATLTIAFIVLAARFAIGTVLGALAGWFAGSALDRGVSALIDAFGAFPTVLFAIVWIFAFDIRSGVSAFALALAITGWWGFGRVTRSAVTALRGRPFLEAARTLGLSEFAIFARHIVPNLLPMLAVATALEASAILLVLGELGFLGIVVGGGQNVSTDVTGRGGGGTEFLFATTEWGATLSQGKFDIYRAPWIALVPAAAFASAVLGFNLIGHGLRTFFERAPVALGKLLSVRSALAVAIVVLGVRAATPYLGPAGSFVTIAREFDAVPAMAHIGYLADPARGGRYSGSPGYADAAQYIADRFGEIGLEPLGEGGSYYQPFTMPIVHLRSTPTFQRLGPTPKPYVLRADFTERVGGRAGSGTAEGDVVYVGGGIRNRDYSDYAGVHPEGNIVLIAGPSEGDPIDAAIRAGARGAIVVLDPETPLLRFSYFAAFEQDTIPVIAVPERVADELIAGSGKRVGDLRRELEDRRRRAEGGRSSQGPLQPLSFDTSTRVRFSVDIGPVEEIRTANVAGMLRGADADRSQRFVVVGAHLDGVGTDVTGTVFPAANDNASGPAAVIEVARVLAAHRELLRNSIVFVAFAGEEEGLIGSDAFLAGAVTKPYRAANIVAMVNLDMVGCCGGVAASDESFALHQRFQAAADRLGYGLSYVPGFGGSDHLAFLRRRVPAIMIAGTELGALHTYRDTPSTVDPRQLEASGEIVLQAVLEIAGGQ